MDFDASWIEDRGAVGRETDAGTKFGKSGGALFQFIDEVGDRDAKAAKPDFVGAFGVGSVQGRVEFGAGLGCEVLTHCPDGEEVEQIGPVDHADVDA